MQLLLVKCLVGFYEANNSLCMRSARIALPAHVHCVCSATRYASSLTGVWLYQQGSSGSDGQAALPDHKQARHGVHGCWQWLCIGPFMQNRPCYQLCCSLTTVASTSACVRASSCRTCSLGELLWMPAFPGEETAVSVARTWMITAVLCSNTAGGSNRPCNMKDEVPATAGRLLDMAQPGWCPPVSHSCADLNQSHSSPQSRTRTLCMMRRHRDCSRRSSPSATTEATQCTGLPIIQLMSRGGLDLKQACNPASWYYITAQGP
jgi:hypothetical protein